MKEQTSLHVCYSNLDRYFFISMIVLFIVFSFSSAFAREIGGKFQSELPRAPACPKGYETEAESLKEESEKKEKIDYNFSAPEICIPIEYESSYASALKYEFEKSDKKENEEFDFDLEELAIIVLYGLAGIVFIFFVLFIIRQKYQPRFKEKRKESEGIIEHLETITKNQKHTALANEGDFDIAVHALLLEVLREVFRAEPDLEKPSITAREVGHACSSSVVSPDLDPLIKVVELSRFANRHATQEQYSNLKPRANRLIKLFRSRSERAQEEIR